MWACDTITRSTTCFAGRTAVTQRGDTRFAHCPAPALPFCSHITSAVSFNNDVLMHAIHSAAPPVYNVQTQHCMTPYCTDSTQPGVLSLCLLLASSAHFERARPALASSCTLLLARFCSHFVCFCFSDFLLFWRDLWVILVLFIFVCCSLLCGRTTIYTPEPSDQ